MTRIVTIFVVVSLIEAIVLGISVGLDVAAVVILATLIATGVLAIVVARKSERDPIGPATCSACGGLMSPNAPYCKHCGEPVVPSAL
jgi:hypothetical protein